jgi:probable DNA metabolism protein
MRELICDETLRELSAIPGFPELLRGMQYVPETESIQGDLFGDVSPSLGESMGPAFEAVPPELFEVSVDAYYAAVLAALSELPLGGQIRRFCQKALAAEEAVTDRGDDDVRAVLEAAAKVTREIDRLRGLLRFNADKAGMYIARCAPDHFVLPAMAGHFELRFGETPWAIIDEKRGLALVRLPGEEPRLVPGAAFTEAADSITTGEVPASPQWEDLWRNYHHSVNNEDRKNPNLQRQFMPARYWKYLTEMRP